MENAPNDNTDSAAKRAEQALSCLLPNKLRKKMLNATLDHRSVDRLYRDQLAVQIELKRALRECQRAIATDPSNKSLDNLVLHCKQAINDQKELITVLIVRIMEQKFSRITSEDQLLLQLRYYQNRLSLPDSNQVGIEECIRLCESRLANVRHARNLHDSK